MEFPITDHNYDLVKEFIDLVCHEATRGGFGHMYKRKKNCSDLCGNQTTVERLAKAIGLPASLNTRFSYNETDEEMYGFKKHRVDLWLFDDPYPGKFGPIKVVIRYDPGTKKAWQSQKLP